MSTVIDMMIHVNDSAVKPLMEASLARTPGVIEARLKSLNPTYSSSVTIPNASILGVSRKLPEPSAPKHRW